MQVLGKRNKVLLIAVAIAMLVALGVLFALWDTSVVKAANGDLSTYANAKVGDVITFGNYYQTGNRINNDENAEYEKTPIEWIVVDKDERTGQLTLMSKYILAAGSYFGNYYYDINGNWKAHYKTDRIEVNGIQCNQAYVESTVRAFLNNLERRDLGGDSYSDIDGYKTSVIPSVKDGELFASVGFSNRIYTFTNEYKRPITNVEYRNRPATRGFYDEAFTDKEKAMIMLKEISGYIGHRWPNNEHSPTKITYVEGTLDKVWLPSVTELNIMNAEDNLTNPSDEVGSNVFEYFKGKTGENLQSALIGTRSPFVTHNSKAMNCSIPVYQYQSIEINEDIHETMNSTDAYWTRSPVSHHYYYMRCVNNAGNFSSYVTDNSHIGIRPCVIMKY